MTNIDHAVGMIEAMIEHDVEILAADPADTGDRTHGPAAIARALAAAGLLMPDGMSTQTETVGPYFPEGEEMPDLPEPDGCDADGLPYWGEGDYRTALTWHPCDRDVPRSQRPLLIHSPISPWMHPDELEAEALRALAAARAARQALEKA